MAQYVAVIGTEVAVNLEGIARVRLEKPPRQYQTDAAVHEAYMKATSGGGENEGDGEVPEAEGHGEAPKAVVAFFEPLPWGITTTEDIGELLDFKHRVRLSPLAKELLKLACMQPGAWDWLPTVLPTRFGLAW